MLPKLREQSVAHAIEHPTEDPRTTALMLRKPRFAQLASQSGPDLSMFARPGPTRRAELAAAESLAAIDGGPTSEHALRDLRAGKRRAPTLAATSSGRRS